MESQLVAEPLPTQDSTTERNTSRPGFEPTVPVFKRFQDPMRFRPVHFVIQSIGFYMKHFIVHLKVREVETIWNFGQFQVLETNACILVACHKVAVIALLRCYSHLVP